MAEKNIGHQRPALEAPGRVSGQDFDFVVTVCDNARDPIFQGAPERIHWSIADSSAVEGDEETRLRAFRIAADELMTRIRYLLLIIERKLSYAMETLSIWRRSAASVSAPSPS
jgi:arsenate reductase (thioredoxin)